MSIGIGIIGAGVMGADHARTVATSVAGAKLVAVSDADHARANAAAKANGALRDFSDGLALIADPDVHAVIVASPDHTHAGFVLACLAAGKPVLCEKPLAPTPAECLELVEAERRVGKRLIQVGFMRRFDPFYGDMRDTLLSGDLGAPLLLHCAHRNATAPGFFTPEMSITNAAVHEFDIIRWLLDDEIVTITALSSVTRRKAPLRDPIMLVAEMASGVLADIELYMNAAYGYDIRTELVCEDAVMNLARPQPVLLSRTGSAGASFPADWRGRFGDAYRRQMQSWVNAIGSGAPVGSSAWDGYVAMAVADAALQSMASGGRVDVRLEQRPAFY